MPNCQPKTEGTCHWRDLRLDWMMKTRHILNLLQPAWLSCFVSTTTWVYIHVNIYIYSMYTYLHWNHKYLFTSVVQPARIHLWFSGPMVWAGPIPLAPLDVGCSQERPASRTRQISSDSCFVTVLYPVKLPYLHVSAGMSSVFVRTCLLNLYHFEGYMQTFVSQLRCLNPLLGRRTSPYWP